MERLPRDLKPKGFLHWVSVHESQKCEVREYDVLFNVSDLNSLEDYMTGINKESKVVYNNS